MATTIPTPTTCRVIATPSHSSIHACTLCDDYSYKSEQTWEVVHPVYKPWEMVPSWYFHSMYSIQCKWYEYQLFQICWACGFNNYVSTDVADPIERCKRCAYLQDSSCVAVWKGCTKQSPMCHEENKIWEEVEFEEDLVGYRRRKNKADVKQLGMITRCCVEVC